MTLDTATSNNTGLTFRVKPRLLTLLGDQLIRDANVAVFELVKNAYDADAESCKIILEYPDDPATARIVIEDDGRGMNENILRSAWMVIATDFRAEERRLEKRTPKYHRLPLGEKGLGRLSIHKLGRFIRLITRQRGGPELVMEFDWDRLEGAKSLDRAPVRLLKRAATTFPGNTHGTRLEVERLRETWSRGEVRRLYRAVNALRSPFKGPADFDVTLSLPQRDDWLEGMFAAGDANRSAIYHVRDSFEGATARFVYRFKPPPGLERQLSTRKEKIVGLALERKVGRKSERLDLASHRIGKVRFDFWLFDRDPAVLRAVTDDVKGLKDYLDENGGIRIYRDGIRVYDFGEPGNDWLNLDIRRVNTPTARTSNNQILGALQLSALDSADLREKTNREGFIETPAFGAFRDAVISVLTHVEAEKTKDQRRLREAMGRGTGQNLLVKLSDLRDVLERKGILSEVEPTLKAVEREMEQYRDQLLHAAVPGLTIGLMLHGAEKILEELRAATKRNIDLERIKELVDRLYRAMRPVTNLLKNPGTAKTSAETLIKEALFSTELRLRRHRIKLVEPIGHVRDFEVQGSRQMLIASIANLVDNSIHWLESKNPSQKLLYIGLTRELEAGPAIVVADNGPGFGNDSPEDLITPFFTRRNGGMGLGLYIVSEVMRVNKGKLVFPDIGEVALPDGLTGAVVALQFPPN